MKYIKLNKRLKDDILEMSNKDAGLMLRYLVYLSDGDEIQAEDFPEFERAKKNLVSITASPKKGLHPFEDSEYSELDIFREAFEKSATFMRNRFIDIDALHQELLLCDSEKYKYSNWIKVAQQWYNRNPKKYHFSVKKEIAKDPRSGILNKEESKREAFKLQRDIRANQHR